MGKRDELVGAYLGALEVRPVMILAPAGGRPARIAAEPDARLELIDALYFAKPQHAELVLSRTLDDLKDVGALRAQGWIDMPARDVRNMVANVTGYLGASFQSETEVRRNAEITVDRIIARVEG